MDDIEGKTPPQLSSDGAKLLADVLAKRADDRHNTLVEQRNSRRREADALRHPPTDVDRAEPGTALELASSSLEARSAASEGLDDQDHLDEGSARVMRWLLLIALGVVIGLAFSVVPSLGSVLSSDDDVEVSQDTDDDTADVAPADDELDVETIEAEVAGRQVNQAPPSGSNVTAGDIEVSVYDASPSNGEVYSFALRLRSIATDEELSTENFTVRVEDEFGISSTTFSRFIHETLPVNSSALATVRAEGVGPSEQFVVVWYEDVLLDRILIETQE